MSVTTTELKKSWQILAAVCNRGYFDHKRWESDI